MSFEYFDAPGFECTVSFCCKSVIVFLLQISYYCYWLKYFTDKIAIVVCNSIGIQCFSSVPMRGGSGLTPSPQGQKNEILLMNCNVFVVSFTWFRMRMPLQFQRRIIREFDVKELFTIIIFNKTWNNTSKERYKWGVIMNLNSDMKLLRVELISVCWFMLGGEVSCFMSEVTCE